MKGWEKDPKGRIKEQNAEKISCFFNYSYSLKSSLSGMQRKVTFLGTPFFNGKYTKEDTFSVKNGINMGHRFIPGAVTPHIKLCWVPRVVERVNVAFDMLIWKSKIFQWNWSMNAYCCSFSWNISSRANDRDREDNLLEWFYHRSSLDSPDELQLEGVRGKSSIRDSHSHE